MADIAWGRVMTDPARLVELAFLTANMGVIVTGDAPLIVAVLTLRAAFRPRVLRSFTAVFTLPPSEVGAMVGMVGETLGRETASVLALLLPNVLNSLTSAALAVMAALARRTVTMKTVRINFIS